MIIYKTSQNKQFSIISDAFPLIAYHNQILKKNHQPNCYIFNHSILLYIFLCSFILQTILYQFQQLSYQIYFSKLFNKYIYSQLFSTVNTTLMFSYTSNPFVQIYYPNVYQNQIVYYLPFHSPNQECSVNRINIIPSQEHVQTETITLKQQEDEQVTKSKEKKTKKIEKQQVKEQKEKKKNIRNIIPNLARKIISYITSNQSKVKLKNLFPNMPKPQISKFYQYVNSIKSQLSFYVGNKDLLQIWYKQTKSIRQMEYIKIIRILSKHYLNNMCISSILLSKRMKPSLKEQHLRYRRKMLYILKNGFKQQFMNGI